MSIAKRLAVQKDHVVSFFRLRQHFKHPWLIALLRLGVLKLRYFPYVINNGSKSYAMLARPDTSSMGDFFVLREVLVQETYRDALGLLPDMGLRVVDIGANLGSFTVWLCKTVKVDKIFCFEPEPDSFRLLKFNLASNGCRAACALEKAVGGQSRRARIALKQESPGGASIYRDDGEVSDGNTIDVVALSDWLKETTGDFHLLKMDCEGAEWEIFRRTASPDLRRFGAIIAEVHSDPERLQPVEEFGSLVEAAGFRTVRWDRKAAGLYVGVRDQMGVGS